MIKRAIWIAGMAIGLAMSMMAWVPVAQAALLASEDFNYADGLLAGNNGGTGFSGAWINTATVASGVANTAGSASFRTLSTPITPISGARAYVSFDFGADPGFNNDFAGLSFFSGGGERLLFGMTFNTDTFGLNVTGFANTGSAVGVDTTPDFLVGEVLFTGPDAMTTNLYLNPTGFLGSPVATYTGNFIPGGGTWDQIRLASGGSPNTVATFDNIRIGTRLSDVMNVPEPATLALMGLGLAGMGYRRHRSKIAA